MEALDSTLPGATIVGEVSQNWIDGVPAALEGTTVTLSLGLVGVAARFEALIAFNAARGYILGSWQLSRVSVGTNQINETIVAVFRRYNWSE